MVGRRPTRATELRDTEMRQVLDQLSTSPLHVPEHEIPDEMEYGWVAAEVVGWKNDGNIKEKARLGWKAVPAERHPMMGAEGTIFGASDRAPSENKGFIEFRGLILCERPKALGEAIRRAREREHMEIMQSTPGMDSLSTGYVRENRQTLTRAEFQE